MKNILISITLVVMFLVACSSEKTDGDFPSSEILTADSISIGEVLEPSSVGLTEFYAVVSSPKSNKVIYRYSVPDWTFMDTTFSKGQGPDDMLYPTFLKNNIPSENLWVFDNNKREIRCLHLSPEEVTVQQTISQQDVIQKVNAWYGTVVNNKYLIENKLNRATEENFMYSYDLGDSLRIKDSVRTLAVSSVKEMDGGWSATTTNVPNVFVYGGRMMMYYNILNTSHKFKIGDEGSLTLEDVYGQDYSYQEVKNLNMEEITEKTNSYTRALACDDKYIYLQRVGYNRTKDQQGHDSIDIVKNVVEVYSWAMTPVKKFILDKTKSTNVLTDLAHNKFYSWDEGSDFERIYVYSFDME